MVIRSSILSRSSIGPALLGRVVDVLGNPVDGKRPIEAAEVLSSLRATLNSSPSLGKLAYGV
jgi:F0F1-type ATP synthase alpha subunit